MIKEIILRIKRREILCIPYIFKLKFLQIFARKKSGAEGTKMAIFTVGTIREICAEISRNVANGGRGGWEEG